MRKLLITINIVKKSKTAIISKYLTEMNFRFLSFDNFTQGFRVVSRKCRVGNVVQW